jgi:hypothetical protein
MLWAGRIISWVLIVTGGLTWTVGQAGVGTTDKNLCELASAIWQAPIQNCHIVPLLVYLWQAGLVLAVIFLIFDFLRWLKNRKSSVKRRAKFQDRDREISLTDALLWISEESGWGRWQRAHPNGIAWEAGKYRLRTASVFVQTACLNTDLTIRGRLKNSVDYNGSNSRSHCRDNASHNSGPGSGRHNTIL